MNEQATELLDKMQLHRDAGDDYTQIKLIFDQAMELDRSKYEFADAEFSGFDFHHYDFSALRLGNTTFTHCRLDNTNFSNSSMDNITIGSFEDDYIVAERCNFSGSYMQSARIKATVLSNAYFHDSKLHDAVLDGCILTGADFSKANITKTEFNGCTVDDSTKFAQLKSCRGAKIDRFLLECLGRERGGLTPGNLMDMTVEDDVAKLRSQFGGVWALLHLIGLIIFAAPYVWFLATHYAIARWDWADADQTVTLGGAFARFILSGGRNWQSWQPNWFSFAAFILYFAYNLARLLLVWKTKMLETKQEVTGYPVRFRLKGSWWGTLDVVLWWAFLIAAIIVVFNTMNFLSIKLPVNVQL